MKYWDRIEELCKEKNVSFFYIMQVADISFSSSYQMRYKRVPPTVKTINKFCEAIGISLSDFFNSPSFNSPNKQKVFLELWRNLSQIEKHAIINTLNEFKKIRLSKTSL